MDAWQRPISEDFITAVGAALAYARVSPDEAVRYMVDNVPIFGQFAPDPIQAMAGGCSTCIYLGLWADRWEGKPSVPHGMIWLFESGIRKIGGSLETQTRATLLHEMDHALQRDHVLEAMHKKKAASGQYHGAGVSPAARAMTTSCRPCYRNIH